MQTNENHPNRKRIRNFFREKGYYIVLALCVCAVGVSGWLFVSGAIAEKKALRQETMSIATSAEDPAKNPSAEQKPAPTATADEETAPAAAMTDESVREAAKTCASGQSPAAHRPLTVSMRCSITPRHRTGGRTRVSIWLRRSERRSRPQALVS